MNRLFVYGSLQPGQSNEHVLSNLGGIWEKAFIYGRLYNAGWGSGMGFPGLRLEDQSEKINGYLFTSDKLNGFWNELDEFEGDEYQRVKAPVKTYNEDRTIEAYVYTLR